MDTELMTPEGCERLGEIIKKTAEILASAGATENDVARMLEHHDHGFVPNLKKLGYNVGGNNDVG